MVVVVVAIAAVVGHQFASLYIIPPPLTIMVQPFLTIHYASCTMHHAPCTMHHAPCPIQFCRRYAVGLTHAMHIPCTCHAHPMYMPCTCMGFTRAPTEATIFSNGWHPVLLPLTPTLILTSCIYHPCIHTPTMHYHYYHYPYGSIDTATACHTA